MENRGWRLVLGGCRPFEQGAILCVPGGDQAGWRVRGAVIAVVTPSGVGGMIATVSDGPIFEFDIVRVDVAKLADIGQPGTRAVRQSWTAG